MTTWRLLLLSVVRPSLEYDGEIWDCNKSQARALESILLGGAKKILGCSSVMNNIFHFLSLDKGGVVEDMHEGNSSLKSFMACVENDVREREADEFGKGLDSKVKLDLY